ncbi:MAG TPA: hypothetical protein VFC65_05610 [Prolixibacteraceae bacterium]|nr:hypothetical protein [Prolixibacteraceae bacterium]
MTTVVSSYLLFAPEGFGLPYMIAVSAGIAFAVAAAILFFVKKDTNKAVVEVATVPD